MLYRGGMGIPLTIRLINQATAYGYALANVGVVAIKASAMAYRSACLTLSMGDIGQSLLASVNGLHEALGHRQ